MLPIRVGCCEWKGKRNVLGTDQLLDEVTGLDDFFLELKLSNQFGICMTQGVSANGKPFARELLDLLARHIWPETGQLDR